MPRLTKTVRNLLLATLFGTAIVLVKTEPVLANYPDCPPEIMGCLNADPNNFAIVHGDATECYFGYILINWSCAVEIEPDEFQIIGGGLCFDMNASGGYNHCDEG